MKYTVIIRQPVPDNVRANLEKQLVERFGLNEEQAQRLAARRAGRLMKPTSQPRAELLLSVFEAVGAQVALEEVREETDTPSLAFQAAPRGGDDAELAPLLRGSDTGLGGAGLGNAAAGDAFSSGGASPFAPAGDPFGAGAAGHEFSPRGDALVDPAELLPDWARQSPLMPVTPPPVAPVATTSVPVTSGLVASVTPASGAPTLPVSDMAADLGTLAGRAGLGAVAAPIAAPAAAAKPADDWADFAGGLNLPETSAAAPASSEPRQSTEFLTAVTEDSAVKVGRRNSLSNQIRWGTLLPLGLSGLLTLVLLGISVPGLQQRLVQDSARAVASTLGLNLNTGSQSLANAQLETTVNQSSVGFVQVELPSGTTYLRSKLQAQDAAYNTQVSGFLKSHPSGGVVRLGAQNYAVQRVSIIQDAKYQPSVTNLAGETQGTLVHRIAVGVPTTTSSTILRNTLLLVLLSTVIGLLIASLLAAQAARRIVQPISDLVKVADAISMGDLTRPVRINSNDEIGDLAQALERMRLSLEAAMDRLRRRKRG